MRREVKRLDTDRILREYPTIVQELPGWFFRVRETSNLVWRGEGIDVWGRRVSHPAEDPDSAIKAAIDAARLVQTCLTGDADIR
ncbi:MAG: hypothetical protein RBS17_08245 [Coriobacteriia bacterium]|jgi:hypothetical protein|nr:hypothetical protein [Coriobacteriia bacterium]